MICPYASDPNACVTEKRARHYRSLPYQRIECDYCPHAYANGLAADRPTDTFAFIGGSKYHCPECGRELPSMPKFGICGPCRSILYGSSFRKPCPKCGKPMSITAPECRSCYRERIKSDRTVCPKCGGKKHPRAKLCAACHKAAQRKPGHCTAPGCRNKVEAAGLCYRHYRSRPRRAA